MDWHTGLGRLRLVGTASLILGVVLCASVFVTRTLGYAPNPSFASLFTAMWPLGLGLIMLGALLWVAVWVLHGFIPPVAAAGPDRRRGHLSE